MGRLSAPAPRALRATAYVFAADTSSNKQLAAESSLRNEMMTGEKLQLSSVEDEDR